MINDGDAKVVANGVGVIHIGEVADGLFAADGREISVVVDGGTKSIYSTDDEISCIDSNGDDRFVVILGHPSHRTRAVVIDMNGTEVATVAKRQVLRAIYAGPSDVLLQGYRRVGGVDRVTINVSRDGREAEELLLTSVALRAEMVSNLRGTVFVAGTLPSSGRRGCWLLTCHSDGPYASIVSAAPSGYGAFVDPSTVAFGSEIDGRPVLVVAGEAGAHALPLPIRPPRKLAVSPTGRKLAWAAPTADGGTVYGCAIGIIP